MPGYVDTRGLKEWATRRPPDSHLRALLLAEKDELAPEVFLNRLPVWAALLKLEASEA